MAKKTDSEGKGGGEKKKECTQCKKQIPESAKYCQYCGHSEEPDFEIEVNILEGASEVKIFIETYKGRKEEPCDFVWHVQGQDPVTDRTADGSDLAQKKGTKFLSIPFSDKRRQASFHVVGGLAKITEPSIPPSEKKVKTLKPDPAKSFLNNLLGR